MMLTYGKVPPQVIEVEKAILGICMLEREAFQIVKELLHADTFYTEGHKKIFRAMELLSKVNSPIDILTVTEELRKSEELELAGGSYYVTTLTNNVVGIGGLQKHCRIVLEKFLKRELIRISGEIHHLAFEDSEDVFETIDYAEIQVAGILKNNMRKPIKKLDTVIVEAVQDIEKARHLERDVTGVPSNYSDLDRVTSGWQGGDLIILAARPGVGKTAFALNLAKGAVRNEIEVCPTLLFSLEMRDSELVKRCLSAESHIWFWKIRNGRMDDDEMKKLYDRGVRPLANAPIWIDDTAGIELEVLISKIRVMHAKHHIKMVIVDYLQLIVVKGNTIREQQIAEISRRLKVLAKELNIPIIALAQLSRDVEKRGGDGEPKPSDLRESGAIEQDADVLMFLWRPTDEQIKQDASLHEVTYAKLAKHRNGAHARFIGIFEKEYQRWTSLTVVDDNTLQPISNNWKPVHIGAPVDFTQSRRESESNEALPF